MVLQDISILVFLAPNMSLKHFRNTALQTKFFDIVNSTAYPGWGHMIDSGATTIWETWKESDNTYSNCHPMFGTVTEWYYRWLGGIRPDPENPGFYEVYIGTVNSEGLEFVNCTYHSPYGPIVSNWKKVQPGGFIYEMKIPDGSIAKVVLPLNPSQKISVEKNGKRIEPEEIEGFSTGKFQLSEGKYIFTVGAK